MQPNALDAKKFSPHNKKMISRPFCPEEIIFAATSACNLRCGHCFVSKSPQNLDIDAAKRFLASCLAAKKSLPRIQKIGFSGGEPFLRLDFIIALTQFAVKNDLLFDQIMTNGEWWQSEDDLRQSLQKVYDAGYDGKIGLSWDSFHGQSERRMRTFIQAVQNIFGDDALCIQSVSETVRQGNQRKNPGKKNQDFPAFPDGVPVFFLPRTYPAANERAWQAKRWFKDDFCAGPGHVLFVHPDGNIAPCCGFANENPALFIGNITDDFERIMENAAGNQMIKICYEEGLAHFRRHGLRKKMRARKKQLPGRTSDICTFCDFVCSQNLRDSD